MLAVSHKAQPCRLAAVLACGCAAVPRNVIQVTDLYTACHGPLQADAKADASERAAAQSATLEALLEIFFRVLKQTTASGLMASGAGAPGLIISAILV